MSTTIKKAKAATVEWWNKFNDEDTFSLAAALAYYTLFALPPILLVIINTTGLLMDEQSVKDSIFKQLGKLAGSKGVDQIQATMENVGIFDSSWIMNIVGIGILLFTATTVFSTIQIALNRIFHLMPKPSNSIVYFLKTRFISFTLILAIGFLLLVSLVLSALIDLFSQYISELVPIISEGFVEGFSWIVQLLASILLFALLFRVLPDGRVAWRDLLKGATFTAVLFALGRYVIAVYVEKSELATIYKAAGSVIIILIWAYYSSLIFYVGAQVTYVIAKHFGKGIVPTGSTVTYNRQEIIHK